MKKSFNYIFYRRALVEFIIYFILTITTNLLYIQISNTFYPIFNLVFFLNKSIYYIFYFFNIIFRNIINFSLYYHKLTSNIQELQKNIGIL